MTGPADAALDALFDAPDLRGLPLAPRMAVTAALEAALGRIVDIAAPDLFVEVGAFEADFSRGMRARFPQAAVLAYEANPRVHARFAAAAAAAGVDYRHAAISDADGEARFNIVEVVAGTDRPRENRMGSLHDLGLRDSRTVPVSVRAARLDGELAAIPGRRACLWVDVEGAAAMVLRGAAETLARTAILYCEVETGQVWKEQALAAEVAAAAAAAGFVLAARDCQKWFQRNCLFLRPDLAADRGVQAALADYRAAAEATFAPAAAAFRAGQGTV